MSTVIENFYILPISSMEEVNTTLFRMKELVKKVARKKVIAVMAKDFLTYKFFNNEPKIGMFIQMHYEDYYNEDIFSLYDRKFGEKDSFLYVYLNFAKLSEQLGCAGRLDYSTTIYFKTQGDKTFFSFFNKSYREDLVKEFNKEFNLQRYDYWDNSDRPSSISASKWEKRREEYEELTSGGYLLNDFMYAATCNMADSLKIGLYDDIKKGFPSSKAIKTFIFSEHERNRIFEEEKRAGKVNNNGIRADLLKMRIKSKKEEIDKIEIDRDSLIQSFIKDRVEVF